MKEILAVMSFPKATYMYWQKHFKKSNPNEVIEQKIIEIRNENKDFGYRQITGELKKTRSTHKQEACAKNCTSAESPSNFVY